MKEILKSLFAALGIGGLFVFGQKNATIDVNNVSAGLPTPRPETIQPPVLNQNESLSLENAVRVIEDINRNKFNNQFQTVDILAVMSIESSFRPWVFRDEPHINDRSIGLMQVLTSTAKDRGYTGDEQGLYDIVTNITIGMAHLKWSFDFLERSFGRPPSEIEWIGSYNFGVGNAAKGLLNHTYYNKFQREQMRFKGIL